MEIADVEALSEEPAAYDREAFARLFDAYRNTLRRLLEARLDRRTLRRMDVSDVIQNTYLEAQKKYAAYARNPWTSFTQWLGRLAREQAAAAYRRNVGAACRNVACEVSGDAPCSRDRQVTVFETLADPDPSAGTLIDREHMKKRVRETVEAMNKLDREVLLLRSLNGLRFAEVAAALGIEEDTAKVRHYRAKLRFEEAFTAGGGVA